jgi:hypothetical protein
MTANQSGMRPSHANLPPSAISPGHNKYGAVDFDAYLDAALEQEKLLAAAGMPVDGIVDFLRVWEEGWGGKPEVLEQSMDPAIVYTDATSWGLDVAGMESTLEASFAATNALPDGVVYPWDHTPNSLPYWDVTDGVARIVIPWRGVGRWSAPLKVHNRLPKIPNTNKDVHWKGVDRYEFSGGPGSWRISRIDTDWNVINVARQLSPDMLTAASHACGQALMRIGSVVMPIANTFRKKGEPSPLHAHYRGMCAGFYEKVRAQQARLSSAGLAADGLADFTESFLEALSRHDLQSVSELIGPDVIVTGFGADDDREYYGRELIIDRLRRIYRSFPDISIYPQDRRLRALPVWDFYGGQKRVAIPWRAVGRLNSPLQLSHQTALPATHRSINIVGVSRLTLTDDWRILRIDTSWDPVGLVRQAVPGLTKLLPAPKAAKSY